MKWLRYSALRKLLAMLGMTALLCALLSVGASAEGTTPSSGKFVQFEAGRYLLKDDGTVWLFDRAKHTVQRLAGMNDIVKISGSYAHVLALRKDGKIVSYGWNSHGQLGDAYVSDGNFYVADVVGLTDVVDVAAAFQRSYALKKDGSLWVWGDNAFGMQGYNTFPIEFPVRIPGSANIVGLAPGDEVSLLKKDGTVAYYKGSKATSTFTGTQSFGKESFKTGYRYNNLFPVSFMSIDKLPGLSGVKKIWGSNFGEAKFAMQANGAVWMWGDLYGNDVDGRKPKAMKEIVSPKKIVAGVSHALFLMPDGTVRGSGSNALGERGDGVKTKPDADDVAALFHPKKIAGLKGIADVWAGQYESYALGIDGTTLWFWGDNNGDAPVIPKGKKQIFAPTKIPYTVAKDPFYTQKPYGPDLSGIDMTLAAPEVSAVTPVPSADGDRYDYRISFAPATSDAARQVSYEIHMDGMKDELVLPGSPDGQDVVHLWATEKPIEGNGCEGCSYGRPPYLGDSGGGGAAEVKIYVLATDSQSGKHRRSSTYVYDFADKANPKLVRTVEEW